MQQHHFSYTIIFTARLNGKPGSVEPNTAKLHFSMFIDCLFVVIFPILCQYFCLTKEQSHVFRLRSLFLPNPCFQSESCSSWSTQISNGIHLSDSFVKHFTDVSSFPSLDCTSKRKKEIKACRKRGTRGRGSVAEVLLGKQQQGFAIHLERTAGDRAQGKLLLSPSQPLGHVVPAPKDWLQTWRWKEKERIR